MSAVRPVPDNEGGPRVESLFDRFTDPAVRDLVWLLSSADLLRAQAHMPLAQPWPDDEAMGRALAWLARLDLDPSSLHAALDGARITRLGRYAETLLAWYLGNGPEPRLVAANVPLRGEGRTLGECDFLVETPAGQRLHWELAVKCFLHAGTAGESGSRLADYVGPNLRDRLDLKFAHLRDHQLRLSERPEFASLGFEGPWRAQMFIKGWLFYRADEQVADAPELAREHNRGWWVTHADSMAFAQKTAAGGWSVLPRLAWLAPRHLTSSSDIASNIATNSQVSEPNADGCDAAARSSRRALEKVDAPTDPATLFANLARPHEPTMVAAFIDDGAGGYVERSRGFIVPDDWPARALAYARP
ncbi:MAG TPA: DUF1853 family protein [Paraburkholderia sp.]|jgi:hypothetical protein|uniref:DUF1853 family protein n=1 Tax=Paraburkholderia sp. TaxID=1926495 RepID=UPI002DEB4324|nr:DUF1853 family protein [Paraburkholderia sp.]